MALRLSPQAPGSFLQPREGFKGMLSSTCPALIPGWELGGLKPARRGCCSGRVTIEDRHLQSRGLGCAEWRGLSRKWPSLPGALKATFGLGFAG